MKVPYHWKANFYLQKDQYTYIQQALSVNINEMCMSTDAFSIETIENIWLFFTSKVHSTYSKYHCMVIHADRSRENLFLIKALEPLDTQSQ